MADTFVLKGCWKRKEVVHAIYDREIVLTIANTHPYTLVNHPDFKDELAEYVRIYGADEAAVLYVKGVCNAVESCEQKWVKEGVYVAPDPKAPEVPADSNDILSPFGIVRRPGGAPIDPNVPPIDLNNSRDVEALIDRVMVSVIKRAGLWRDPQ